LWRARERQAIGRAHLCGDPATFAAPARFPMSRRRRLLPVARIGVRDVKPKRSSFKMDISVGFRHGHRNVNVEPTI
jgi:hypothetical protein